MPRQVPNFEILHVPLEALFLEDLEDPPLYAIEVGKVVKDNTLFHVLNCVLRGWPEEKVSPELKTFLAKRNELSVHENCLRGNKFNIPSAGQQRAL